jgi:hypothetical protein
MEITAVFAINEAIEAIEAIEANEFANALDI